LSRTTSRTRRGATTKLVYAVAAFALLAVAWNGFAHRFDQAELSMRRNGDVFERAALNPAWTIAALPAPILPRIAVFGSSQIAVVKSPTVDPLQATPHQLRIALADQGLPVEIVDFSEGGQQTIESLLLYLATRSVARPRAIVIGLSLFSMLRLEVRPTLVAGIDATAVRRTLRALLPDDADPRAAESLLSWSRSGEQRVTSRGKTIQERMDAAIADWLGTRVAAFANRQAMFDALIDQPIRRDLASFVTRSMRQQSTARTYEIGGEFRAAVLAVETLARAAREDGTPLVVVMMPFDDTRPPVPFTEPTQARVRSTLEASARAAEFTLLDLSHALASKDFGSFVDGSPDNLHFDPAGHTQVARRIANAVRPLLAPGRDETR
jgi:hypothetical protein